MNRIVFTVLCAVILSALSAWGAIIQRGRGYKGADVASGPLVVDYQFNEQTNASGQVVDSSTYGNNGYPGAGAALFTWTDKTNTISANASGTGVQWITNTVTQDKTSISVWGLETNTYKMFTDANGTQYVFDVAQAFSNIWWIQDGNKFTLLTNQTTTISRFRVWDDDRRTNLSALVAGGITNHGLPGGTNAGWTHTVYLAPMERDDSGADYSKSMFNDSPNDGTKPGGANSAVYVDNYYSLDGNQWLTLANESFGDFETNDTFSVSMWFYHLGASGSLVTKSDGVTGQGWISNMTVDRFALQMEDTSGNRLGRVSGTLTDGVWYHLAASYDGGSSTNSFLIYVNGALQPLVTLQGGTLDSTILNNVAVEIGARDNGGFEVTGRIKDVRVFTNVVSAATVTNVLYQGTKDIWGF